MSTWNTPFITETQRLDETVDSNGKTFRHKATATNSCMLNVAASGSLDIWVKDGSEQAMITLKTADAKTLVEMLKKHF